MDKDLHLIQAADCCADLHDNALLAGIALTADLVDTDAVAVMKQIQGGKVQAAYETYGNWSRASLALLRLRISLEALLDQAARNTSS